MKKILLILIIGFGAFLRFFSLSASPPSLNWDEAALGYNAYSLMQTGKDEYGKYFPVFTRSFDEYKAAIPAYMMIPAIKIFGLNEIGVRFTTALLGTILIFLIYYLTMQVFKRDWAALASAWAFAIEPWAVHFSRTNHEAMAALFFLLLGLVLFLRSREVKRFLPVSLILFLLSMYTYNSNKIIIPIFLAFLYIINRKFLHHKYLLLAISALFLIPFSILALKGEAFARTQSTNIFVLWGSGHTSFPGSLYYFGWDIISRYLSYASPYNLFVREPYEHVLVIPYNSMFHPYEFVFWFIGIIYLVKNYQKNKELVLLAAITPIPAMLTWSWFQPGRGITLFAVYSLCIGWGMYAVSTKLPKIGKFMFGLFIILFGVSSAVYLLDSLLVQLPYRDAGNWQPGFRETVPAVYSLSKDYDQVIVDTPQAQPYIFYLFYSQYPPDKYLRELDFGKIGKPRKFYDFGKFHFRDIYWPKDRSLPRTLFVGTDYDLPVNDIANSPNTKILSIINDKYGNPIQKIVGTN